MTFNGYNVHVHVRTYRLLALLAVFGGLLALPGAVANAAFPGTNGLIAFERGGNIFTVTTDSAHTVSSSPLVVGATDPAWSPNGNKIAYTQGGRVKVLTISGGAVDDLDSGSAPAWSPDGTMIAYEKTGDIHVIASGTPGSGRNLSNDGAAIEDDPSWSPDDDKIVYARTPTAAPTNGDIYKMDAPSDPLTGGGGNQEPLTTVSSNETQPSYEPNGDRIVYTSDRIGVGQRQIYRVSILGGTETRLTSSSADDSAPTYAPDGTLIAFARTTGGIFTIGSSGSGETSITSMAGDTNPDWQPAAPTNTTLPVITGNFSQGGVMFSSTGTFASASSYAYQWLRCDANGNNCADIGGATSSSYTGTSADVGSKLRVRVTATSTSGSSSATSAETPVIAGPEPKNLVPPKVIVSGTTGIPVAGVTQFSSIGTWTGSGTLTYTYQWKKCQPKEGPCYRILLAAAQSSTFVPTSDLIGWSLRVEVTATNSSGSATEQSESTPLVIGNPPVNTVRPRISVSTTNPTVGQDLTVDNGTWTGFGLAFTYQWRRCDAPGTLPSCVPIPGATTSRYTTTAADLGVTLRAYVTATGIGGSTAAFSDHTFPTIPAPRFAPSMSAAPTLRGEAEIGGTLTASRGTWAGFAPIRYVSTWQRCDATLTVCRAVRGVKGLVYKVTRADLGFRIRLSVVALNSIGSLRGRSEATEPIVLGQPKPRGRRIVGTSRSEYIAGGGGDDVLSGLGGHDTIMGGKGDDRISGGDGNDFIDAGLGLDRVVAGAGSDTILVADGQKDTVDCGPGNDRVIADSIDVLTNCESSSGPTPPTTPEPPVTPDPPAKP